MIAVDTSVWIDFFRDARTRHVDVLTATIYAGQVGIPDLVLTESLQGCDTDREFSEVLRMMTAHSIITVLDDEVAVEAARNYRLLRARGVTVRKTIDTLIATRCIVDEIPLLYVDRDFDPFVRYLGLRCALDASGVN